MLSTTLKPKTCAYEKCGREFMPLKPMQNVCGPLCAVRKVRADKAKERGETRARKKALETVRSVMPTAQRWFNKFIRMRDRDQPCISCGKPFGDSGAFHAGRDAGHYRSIGSASHLRFHEDNVHAQCVKCNQYGAGRAVDYRLGLVARIGLHRVEALETNNEPHKWTLEEVRAVVDTYKAKCKEIESATHPGHDGWN